MARFPRMVRHGHSAELSRSPHHPERSRRTEAEVIALAQSMVSGLNDNAAVYPAPPVAVLKGKRGHSTF